MERCAGREALPLSMPVLPGHTPKVAQPGITALPWILLPSDHPDSIVCHSMGPKRAVQHKKRTTGGRRLLLPPLPGPGTPAGGAMNAMRLERLDDTRNDCNSFKRVAECPFRFPPWAPRSRGRDKPLLPR